MRPAVACLLLLLAPAAAGAQGRFARATTIGTVDSVWSATLNEQRPYLVYTPPSYHDTTAVPHRYAVLYLLDGDAHFHSVSGLAQILGTGVNGTYAIPEMIVVAIPNTNRMRDMSPTRVETGFDGRPAPGLNASGGMGRFLTFLRTELIPHVDRQYRTLPYRVFVGHSLGGITAINALYTMPEVFNAYVAIDPSLWWDNTLLLRQARAWIGGARLEGRALYVAQANTMSAQDTTANVHFDAIGRFDAVMRAHNTSGLRYAFRYYDQDDHGSVPLIATYDALRFIFDGYRMDLRRVMATPDLIREHFTKVSARLGAPFQPSEAALMQLGQFALAQDTAAAIRFFELANEYHPAGHRAWARLGALREARRDPAGARAAYEQVLARRPGDAAARGALERLRR
jgi:uncharacterized protein